MSDGLAAVCCRLQRSSFEEERVFRIRRGDGSEYVGISPSHYCHHTDGSALTKGEPDPENLIDGVVDARYLGNAGSEARVSLPNGETIRVPAEAVRMWKQVQEPVYVLVGP